MMNEQQNSPANGAEASNVGRPSAPTESDLIALTIARVQRVAEAQGVSEKTLCRRLVGDNRLWDQMEERLQALSVGDEGAGRSVTLSLYNRLHSGMNDLEVAAAPAE